MGNKSNRGFGRVLTRLSAVALQAAQSMAAKDMVAVSVFLHRLVMAEQKRREEELTKVTNG